jgi:phage tail sheath protein FI
MPAVLNYPGVYIEEIPSGVRPIVGVSTSDTAFIDYFARGPLNKPVRITSFVEFARLYGGLDTRSEASYAIAQYFLNGGSVAWVVRVSGGTPGTASKDFGTVVRIKAANEGTWGRRIKVTIDTATDPTGRFNVTVREYAVDAPDQIVRTEVHRNLSMDAADARYSVNSINAASELVTAERLAAAGTNALPAAATDEPLTGGDDGAAPTTLAQIQSGIDSLDQIAPAIFSLMCLPGATKLTAPIFLTVMAAATTYCVARRAFLLIDIPNTVTTAAAMSTWRNDATKMPATSPNSAIYFPRLTIPDPLAGGVPRDIPASGTVAGIYGRTDSARGVWKAPAGTDATIMGATLLTEINDDLNGTLNILGVNVLRSFPIFGSIVWGARTTDGSDAKASEWKYVPVRRMALYIEESLYQGLKWVVFEPNDVPLWSQIRLNVGAFMNGLFRQGAFAGITPREAYFVKCDKDTTTQADVDRGIVNVLIGFAPLKPAEFVVLKIQQMAGQSEA